MIAVNVNRVPQHTAEFVNDKIRRKTGMSFAYYKEHPQRIGQRLAELDEEWDIERVLELQSSSLTLLGLLMASRHRRWILFPMMIQGFFLQHAIQGWCPPVGILRRIGFRTQAEIEQERYTLKALRGDFEGIQKDEQESVMNAVCS